MEIKLGLGIVTNVDTAHNIANVFDADSSSTLSIPLDSSISLQEMPIKGAMVLYFKRGMTSAKIVKIWQDRPDLLRTSSYQMLPGEVQYQAASGGYLYFDNDGDVSLVDAGMRNNIRLSKNGQTITVEGTNVVIKNFNNTTLTLAEDGSFKVEQADNDGNYLSSISLTKDGNIEIDANNLKIAKGRFYILETDDIRLGGGQPFAMASIGTTPGSPIPPSTPIPTSTKVKGG